MRVQSLSNSQMAAGKKEKALERMWKNIRVLIIEEISMVAAMLYNMLDTVLCWAAELLSRWIHRLTPKLAFGRVPIVLHLGDFFSVTTHGADVIA